MRNLKYIVLICLIAPLSLFGKSKVISGTIIDEFLKTIPGASIVCEGSVIGKSDLDGKFEVTIDMTINELEFRFVGLESTTISLSDNCNTLEIIMMALFTYDFISLKKADRLRKKRFNKLPEIRSLAYDRGIFKLKTPCYSQEFEYIYLEKE